MKCLLTFLFSVYAASLPTTTFALTPSPSPGPQSTPARTYPTAAASPYATAKAKLTPGQIATASPSATPEVEEQCPWSLVDEITLRTGTIAVTIDRNNPCKCPSQAFEEPVKYCSFSGTLHECLRTSSNTTESGWGCNRDPVVKSDTFCSYPDYDSESDVYSCTESHLDDAQSCILQDNLEETGRTDWSGGYPLRFSYWCEASESTPQACQLSEGSAVECRYRTPYEAANPNESLNPGLNDILHPWTSDIRCVNFTTTTCGIPLSDDELNALFQVVNQYGEDPRATLTTFCSNRPCMLAPETLLPDGYWADYLLPEQACKIKASCEPNIIGEILSQPREEIGSSYGTSISTNIRPHTTIN